MADLSIHDRLDKLEEVVAKVLKHLYGEGNENKEDDKTETQPSQESN